MVIVVVQKEIRLDDLSVPHDQNYEVLHTHFGETLDIEEGDAAEVRFYAF